MTGWWRDNRLWLAALPLTAAGMAAASSYNVVDKWWRTDLHHEIAHGEIGDWVQVHEGYDDALGATSRTYSVRLVGLDEVEEWPYYDDGPRPPSPGLKALQVHLDWRADPDQVIRGCRLSLVDSEGNRYDIDTSDSLFVCTPDNAGGPEPAEPGDTERPSELPLYEDPRPATWSVDPVFLVPEDAELTELRLWWGPPPDYVALSFP